MIEKALTIEQWKRAEEVAAKNHWRWRPRMDPDTIHVWRVINEDDEIMSGNLGTIQDCAKWTLMTDSTAKTEVTNDEEEFVLGSEY